MLARLRRAAMPLSFRKSIQGRIFVVFSLVILAALLLVSLVVYLHMTSIIKRNAIDYVTDSFHRADENVNVAIQDASKLMALVVTNQDIVPPVLMSGNSEVSLEGFRDMKKIDSFLSYLIAYKSNINRISVVSAVDNRVFYDGAPYMDRLNLDQELIDQIMNEPDGKLIIKHTNNDSQDAVTLGRKIMHNRQTIGVAMIDLNYELLSNNYNIRPSEDSGVWVVNESGEVIFNLSGQQEQLSDELLQQSAAQTGVREIKIAGKSSLMVSQISEATGWTTIGVIPLEALMKDSFTLGRKIIQVVLLVYLAVLFVSIGLASHITRNLRRLHNAMKRVQEGNFFVTADIAAKDEVGQFYSMFQSMLGRIRELMEGVKQREAAKREAELAALQAQIRPHFLYNSLNTIKYMASLNGTRNIEEVSGSLIEMLRGVLGNTKEFVALREELSYVNSYLTIQRYKYADRFKVGYEIEDELLDAQVLKLTLQPLVENALTHGIGSLSNNGSILIKAYKDEAELVLEVGDNGVGMTTEQIAAALRDETLKDGYRSGGMGIRNVNERIGMVYGPSYGVKLYSRPGAFTKAEIRIPIEKGESSNAERIIGG
ncbi:sensor histidine kinase [Paenibacillus sp. HB172176]|uniref:sensor histidine kinase n=1 Tax=Paenibacillus sp. HB172176 TaxID=2493690 RepID=UPI0014389873|nr:sensor histidine kinase [Paenibacillus sp. HB172176]